MHSRQPSRWRRCCSELLSAPAVASASPGRSPISGRRKPQALTHRCCTSKVARLSNAHALCPASRNLTDKQLAAIRETGGLVGVNYAVSFLRKDGRRDADTPLDTVVDHIAYLIERLGEDGVGLGSDFDGAMIPVGH